MLLKKTSSYNLHGMLTVILKMHVTKQAKILHFPVSNGIVSWFSSYGENLLRRAFNYPIWGVQKHPPYIKLQ